jgi:hypothetical protein
MFVAVEHLKGASLGKALALLRNITILRKGLPGTNCLFNLPFYLQAKKFTMRMECK